MTQDRFLQVAYWMELWMMFLDNFLADTVIVRKEVIQMG